ncbi:hypothetical protein [Komagataeibacter diospyri]|uniref:hypothetical protein n=1 Tax=Komagataeibacter diospyri TaxID=1932662 RepID=UPI00375796BD
MAVAVAFLHDAARLPVVFGSGPGNRSLKMGVLDAFLKGGIFQSFMEKASPKTSL